MTFLPDISWANADTPESVKLNGMSDNLNHVKNYHVAKVIMAGGYYEQRYLWNPVDQHIDTSGLWTVELDGVQILDLTASVSSDNSTSPVTSYYEVKNIDIGVLLPDRIHVLDFGGVQKARFTATAEMADTPHWRLSVFIGKQRRNVMGNIWALRFQGITALLHLGSI